jgi:hypothetical protein
VEGLERLTPFQRALVEKAIRSGNVAWAERLLGIFSAQDPEPEGHAGAAQVEAAPSSSPPAPPPSPTGILDSWKAAATRQALQGEMPEGPAWERAKAQALALYRKRGGTLPLWVETPRYGRRAGPGSLVVLLLALALYHRVSPKERSMLVFAPIWVLARILGVSRDSVERWLKDPEVRRWVGYRILRVKVGDTWRIAGVILRVRLAPVRQGEEVRGPDREAFSLPLRDLPADIREGVTEAQTLASGSERQYREDHLIQERVWSLVIPLGRSTLSRFKNPLVIYIAALTLPARAERPLWVENLARALASRLRDERNLDWWRKVAWVVLKGLLLGTRAPLALLERGLLLLGEASGVRNPAAWLTAFLKREGMRDLMAFAQGFRAGVGHAA